MKLEVGKTYRTRNGKYVYISHKLADSKTFPYVDTKYWAYAEDGRIYVEYESPHDLVEEVTSSPTAPELEEFHKWDTTIGQKQRREENFEAGSVTLKNRMKEKPTEYVMNMPVIPTPKAPPKTTEGHRVTVPQKILELPGASIPSVLKVGDKVFDILGGEILTVNGSAENASYFMLYTLDNMMYSSMCVDGKYAGSDKYPRFIGLEEARVKGYDVPKQKVKKSRTFYLYFNKVSGTNILVDEREIGQVGYEEREVTFEWEEEAV